MPTLASKLAEIEDVTQVSTYDNLPGSLIPGTIVVMPTGGDPTFSQGGPCIWLHSVRIVYYDSVGIVPEAQGRCVPIIERVTRKLAANQTLDGLVSEMHRDPRAGRWYDGPGTINYGDKPHTGVAFNIEVKEKPTAYTVSA